MTLDELERLEKAATPPQWESDGRRIVMPAPWSEANAQLTAAARNALPELIAEIRKLRDEARHLRGAFKVLHDDGNTTPTQRAWILRVLDGSSWTPLTKADQ